MLTGVLGGGAVGTFTSLAEFDAACRNAWWLTLCGQSLLLHCWLLVSYGPSEGYRPPQDDVVNYVGRELPRLITLLLGSPPAGLASNCRAPGADTFRRRGNRVCRFCSSPCFRPATQSGLLMSSLT